MFYITTYARTLTHRKGPEKGKTVRRASFYSTKSLTDAHKDLRDRFPGSKTYAGEKLAVITHFCLGLPLDEPIVSGGKLIARS